VFVQGTPGAGGDGVWGGLEAGFRDFEVAHPDRGVLTQRCLDEIEAETAAQSLAQASSSGGLTGGRRMRWLGETDSHESRPYILAPRRHRIERCAETGTSPAGHPGPWRRRGQQCVSRVDVEQVGRAAALADAQVPKVLDDHPVPSPKRPATAGRRSSGKFSLPTHWGGEFQTNLPRLLRLILLLE
jgi:hypothetical protein